MISAYGTDRQPDKITRTAQRIPRLLTCTLVDIPDPNALRYDLVGGKGANRLAADAARSCVLITATPSPIKVVGAVREAERAV